MEVEEGVRKGLLGHELGTTMMLRGTFDMRYQSSTL
jgi:hypothetical protein